MTTQRRFAVRVRIDGRVQYAGVWKTAEEAAVARDRLRLHFGVDSKLSYPKLARLRGPASADELRREARGLGMANRSSTFSGVAWSAERDRWRAAVYLGNRRYATIGFFEDEREAAAIRDRVALHVEGPNVLLNFPNERPEPLSLEAARKAVRYHARTNLSSKFRGVSRERGGRWQVHIKAAGARHYLGTFGDAVVAARAYDRAASYLLGPQAKLNFPFEEMDAAPVALLRREARAERKSATTSRYIGVAWSENSHAWGASIYADSKDVFIGYFDDEEEAAVAYDAVLLHLRGTNQAVRDRLNFPDRATKPRSAEEIRAELWARFKMTTTSQYSGVYLDGRTKLWNAHIVVGRAVHHLGAFVDEIDGARAYDRAARELLGASAHVNFPTGNAYREPTPRSGRRAEPPT